MHIFVPHRVQLFFWLVPHRAHLFTFYLKVGIPHFPTGKIYWFKIFFCVTHRVHFFLPHRVQLFFWMVPHRAHLFTFHLKVGIPHFPAGNIYWFKTFFCVTHRVHFFLPHRVQLVFWMVPHRAHLFTFYTKVGISSRIISIIYSWRSFLFLHHRMQLFIWTVPHRAHRYFI